MDQLLIVLLALLLGLVALIRRRSRALPAAVVFQKIVDPAIAHQALVENADAFSDRPTVGFQVALANTHGGGERTESLNSVPYGPHWSVLRRNITAETLHPSHLHQHLAPLQRDAIRDLVAALSSDAPPGRTVIIVRDHIYAAVFAVVARLCFGDGCACDVGAMCSVIRGFQVTAGGIEDALPGSTTLSRLVQWRRTRRLLALQRRMSELFLPHVAAAAAWRVSRKQRPFGGRPRSYIDSLVDLTLPDGGKDDANRRGLRDDEIVILVMEFLGAGTGTVATCLEWTLAHLVDQPEIQKRLRREIVGVAGDTLRVMPYLNAVVLESLRMHPSVPLALRQVHAHDAVGVLGKTTITTPDSGEDRFVQFVVGDIARDKMNWTDPDVFRPERFMAGGEGEGVGPLPGPKEIRMMPFGAGHRLCPGTGMAMANIKCFLAALVQEFEWAQGNGHVDLTELDKFFKLMKTPLCARLTRCT